jgi:hypothetical protein
MRLREATAGLHRMVQALPRGAQRRLAALRAKARRHKVAALVESNRGSAAPPPVPLFRGDAE